MTSASATTIWLSGPDFDHYVLYDLMTSEALHFRHPEHVTTSGDYHPTRTGPLAAYASPTTGHVVFRSRSRSEQIGPDVRARRRGVLLGTCSRLWLVFREGETWTIDFATVHAFVRRRIDPAWDDWDEEDFDPSWDLMSLVNSPDRRQRWLDHRPVGSGPWFLLDE